MVSVTAPAQVLSPCDGDVRVLLPETNETLNIVFKPNVFNPNAESFFLTFRNPNPHVHCNNTRQDTCVLDESKWVYYVTLRSPRNKEKQTMVRIDRYAKDCNSSEERTLNIPGTRIILFCLLLLL